ncbi:MAG: pilin [Patescibacteria group bacterium]
MKRIMLFSMTAWFAGAALFIAVPALAQIIPDQLIPKCNFEAGDTYGLGAFVELAQNVLKLIWGIVGSIALVMFVWGGFLWLTARGEEQQVKQGWDTLINAVIGLVIILGSWVIINTLILAFTAPGTWPSTPASLFGGTPWSQLAGGAKCIKIADLKRGLVPTVGTSAGGGVGGCCYKGTTTGMFKQGNLETCKELVRTGTEEVVFCSGAVDSGACGEVGVGSDGQSHWKNVSCGGSQSIVLVNKDELCGDTPSLIKMCKSAAICERKFGNDSNRYCIDEKTENGLCFLMYEGINASDLNDKKTIVRKFPLDREQCKAQAQEGSTITEGGKTYNVTYKEKRFCSGARELTVDTRFFLNIWRVKEWLNSIISPEDQAKCVVL